MNLPETALKVELMLTHQEVNERHVRLSTMKIGRGELEEGEQERKRGKKVMQRCWSGKEGNSQLLMVIISNVSRIVERNHA